MKRKNIPWLRDQSGAVIQPQKKFRVEQGYDTLANNKWGYTVDYFIHMFGQDVLDTLLKQGRVYTKRESRGGYVRRTIVHAVVQSKEEVRVAKPYSKRNAALDEAGLKRRKTVFDKEKNRILPP